jgi:hypothetical protein
MYVCVCMCVCVCGERVCVSDVLERESVCVQTRDRMCLGACVMQQPVVVPPVTVLSYFGKTAKLEKFRIQ